MLRFSNLPYLFLAVASCIGLLLRYHFINPISWLIYPYWLHAHSHAMFLGWVMNLLYLAFVTHHVPPDKQGRYSILFFLLQLCVTGMLFSFPVQGYGGISIALSTLHTIGIGLFTYWVYQDTRHQPKSLSHWLMRVSLILFFVASLGPFSLGPLVANGLGHSHWYYAAVYFYLHFQYNGVFIFGCLSIFFSLLEKKNIAVNQVTALLSLRLLIAALLPTYALSVLWISPGLWVNVIGLAGALLQCVSFYYFYKTIHPVIPQFRASTVKIVLHLLIFVTGAYIIKLILQVLSAFPDVALMAYANMDYIIAYLHLVLIGVITFFLFAWCVETLKVRSGQVLKLILAGLIVPGFIGLEFVLILGESAIENSSHYIFGFSAMLTIGFVGITVGGFQKQE